MPGLPWARPSRSPSVSISQSHGALSHEAEEARPLTRRNHSQRRPPGPDLRPHRRLHLLYPQWSRSGRGKQQPIQPLSIMRSRVRPCSHGEIQFASSFPTAGGVYHWSTLAGGPRWGRVVGFFTGWINFYGWMFDLAALVQITANISVNMYAIFHQDTFAPEPWHVYIAYQHNQRNTTTNNVFANRVIPHTQSL